MIRVLLCALNARYAHTSLAIRCLSSYACRHVNPDVVLNWREWTINDRFLPLLTKLAEEQADVYAFSCYVWNCDLIAVLSRELKKVKPRAVIIWGGPEASSQAVEQLTRHKAVDYLLSGEGETALVSLLDLLAHDRCPAPATLRGMPGLVWREQDLVRVNEPAPLLDGSAWSFPYDLADLQRDKQRILYYEASRGCPYRCSYCLSSLDRLVRYRPMAQVLDELTQLVAAGVQQVKLVDRTFNCDPDRARTIWQHLIRSSRRQFESNQRLTIFHFELAGDLLDDASLDLLQSAPPGLFRFEIGVQSIHPSVLSAVNRTCDLDLLARQVERLRRLGNCHVHLDLIAGLPGEDLELFSQSFDWVCQLRPHTFQLGFLKVLPGTAIRCTAEKRRFHWLDDPPYEVLQSDRMSFSDLCLLKQIAHLLDIYLNSGLTRATAFVWRCWPRPWDFFTDLAAYFSRQHLPEGSLSPAERLRHLYVFARSVGLEDLQSDWLLELLRTDYQLSGQKGKPDWMGFWENSTEMAAKQQLRALRTAASRIGPNGMRLRLHFDRLSFNWSVFEAEEVMVAQDYLLVFAGSAGNYRLVGQGPFAAGLPALILPGEQRADGQVCRETDA